MTMEPRLASDRLAYLRSVGVTLEAAVVEAAAKATRSREKLDEINELSLNAIGQLEAWREETAVALLRRIYSISVDFDKRPDRAEIGISLKKLEG